MNRLLLASLAVGVAVTSGAAPAQAPARPPAAVETAPVELRKLTPTVTVTGQVQSRASADMAAGVGGALAWVAEPGTRIARGAVVARLDTGELELQREEQKARVTRGEINVRQLTRELERLRASGNAVSRHQLDQAESARDLAQADLDIARATLRQTEERLSRATLRAPFTGVVAQRVKRVGEEVSRGEIVARLLDPETLEIRLFLPLRHVQAIRPGDRVAVRIGTRTAVARVHSIVPAGDARSQSFEVLVDLPDAEDSLSSGSVVQVELPLGEPEARLAVPRDALIIRADSLAVFRINGQSVAERVNVRSGVADGDWVAIEGPVAAGESVVVRGGESLHDGAPVKIVGNRTAWHTRSSSALSAP